MTCECRTEAEVARGQPGPVTVVLVHNSRARATGSDWPLYLCLACGQWWAGPGANKHSLILMSNWTGKAGASRWRHFAELGDCNLLMPNDPHALRRVKSRG